MRNEEYRLNLRNDYVFKVMHYYNEEVGKEIFASLVGAITGEQITYVEFMPTDLYSYDPNGKDVRYDLCARVNTVNAVDLEMQIYHMSAVPDRVNYYASLLYVNQNNKGVSYEKFIDANSIFLCEQNVFTDRREYIHHYCMKDDLNRILTTKMQAHIIELRKGLKITSEMKELSMLEKWILFLMCYEENSENPVIEQLIESEEIFKKAVEVLKVISEDQRIREQAFARNRFAKDMAQIKSDQEKMNKMLREMQDKLKHDLAYLLHGITELEQERTGPDDGMTGLEQGMIEIEQEMAEFEQRMTKLKQERSELEQSKNKVEEMKTELEARKKDLIEEGRSEEKILLIRQMLEDGLDTDLIMKYARCSLEMIQMVKDSFCDS
ncbi:MAG: hypothetical protein E7192_03020 [Erysipelotrichaceae bacterium]|nr:hypothetical protein [Erysipelotrichaceae bacterium]